MAVGGRTIRIEIDSSPPPTIVHVFVDDRRVALISGEDSFATIRAAVQYAVHMK